MHQGQRVRDARNGQVGTVVEIHEDMDCWYVRMDYGDLCLFRDDQVQPTGEVDVWVDYGAGI